MNPVNCCLSVVLFNLLENGENFKLLGSLKCIAGIFKYAKREDVIKFGE